MLGVSRLLSSGQKGPGINPVLTHAKYPILPAKAPESPESGSAENPVDTGHKPVACLGPKRHHSEEESAFAGCERDEDE